MIPQVRIRQVRQQPHYRHVRYEYSYDGLNRLVDAQGEYIAGASTLRHFDELSASQAQRDAGFK